MKNLQNAIVVSKPRVLNEINELHEKIHIEQSGDFHDYAKTDIWEKEIAALRDIESYLSLIEEQIATLEKLENKLSKLK